jgi:hypothetical protein
MVLQSARILSRYHPSVNVPLGRMGQILIIVGSGVDREDLPSGQRNAATSAS